MTIDQIVVIGANIATVAFGYGLLIGKVNSMNVTLTNSVNEMKELRNEHRDVKSQVDVLWDGRERRQNA